MMMKQKEWDKYTIFMTKKKKEGYSFKEAEQLWKKSKNVYKKMFKFKS